MRRITIERSIDEFNFTPRVIFLKDGKEFAKFTLELVDDLTDVLRNREEADKELMSVLKSELNDSELETELLEVWKEHMGIAQQR